MSVFAVADDIEVETEYLCEKGGGLELEGVVILRGCLDNRGEEFLFPYIVRLETGGPWICNGLCLES